MGDPVCLGVVGRTVLPRVRDSLLDLPLASVIGALFT